MKQILVLMVLLSLFSCRSGDEELQQIDQTVQIFMDKNGLDLLNANLNGSYSSVTWNDQHALTDIAPVSYSLKKTADTINYMEYVAGARRILIDSSDMENKIYESEILFTLVTPTSDSTQVAELDTLKLHYLDSKSLFFLKNAYYDGQLVFTKVPGQPNVIKIQK